MSRRGTLVVWLVVLVSMGALPGAALARCGVERWSVKIGKDPDAKQVDLSKSTKTRIPAMRSWTAPNDLPDDQRFAPPETTVYVVDAWLIECREEDSPKTRDSDYHLVLSDDHGLTMIAEIPSPDCVAAASPFRPGIRKARKAFDDRFNVGGRFKPAHVRVRVTGVGFFDFLHGQTGHAPNGIELHPVLDIVFPPSP